MLTQSYYISDRLPMSALASPDPVKYTAKSLTQAEADLRTEAVAIEKLRKSIGEAGAAAPKEQMADFAKRQKAYLDRKIELEKQKRTLTEAPAKPTLQSKPSALIAASKATSPKPKAEFIVEKKPAAKPQPELPLTDHPVAKPKDNTERTTLEESTIPSENSGVSPMVWLAVAAAIAVVAWYFLR